MRRTSLECHDVRPRKWKNDLVSSVAAWPARQKNILRETYVADTQEYDIVILGAGSGGYAAALRAGQLGMKVALDEGDKVGGT